MGPLLAQPAGEVLRGPAVRLLRRKAPPGHPQEYFARQCYVAADADEPSIGFVINYVGDDNIIFNTDYPHPDAPAPEEPVPNMLEQPISDESKRKILWDNSVGLYGPRLLAGRN